ncbi:MAG: porin [Zoogloeaceae bacterium]|jgi:predicted porin|nr:porin [Zoogloeaceae bacterium]
MRKKTLALAIAAAFSGAAFAQQSNVTIYGLIDMGFSHRGNNINAHTGSQNSIDSGVTAGNRLGFKGSEDLGNGLKAIWQLEAGFNADTGVSQQNGRLFGRHASLGLSGAFGTVQAGRFYTPRYILISDIDPFKAGTVGRYTDVFKYGQSDVTRVDNAIAYVSPSFSGFNVTAAYSTNTNYSAATGGQETLGNETDVRAIALMPRYTNGPLDVGFSWQDLKAKNVNTANIDKSDATYKQWTLGASYDFGMVKLAAVYDNYKADSGKAADEKEKLKSWLLGATVPFGKNAVQIAYHQSKLDDKTDKSAGKSKKWALGYTYELSKRTSFYAAYAKTTNDNAKNAHADKVQRKSYVDDSSNSYAGYQSGFQFGLKHKF